MLLLAFYMLELVDTREEARHIKRGQKFGKPARNLPGWVKEKTAGMGKTGD